MHAGIRSRDREVNLKWIFGKLQVGTAVEKTR